MLKRWLAGLLAALFLLLPIAARAQSAPLESGLPFETDAASVLLMDARTGTVILEHNADEHRPVASITKLMTMLLVLEALDEGRISLEDQVTVSGEAAGMGGSQALLDAGGVYPLSELLKSLIVASANDSAVALAELLGGSEDNFASMMNQRAGQLGLADTHYVNASGLPAEGQYTTARDVAALSREVLRHPTYFNYSRIWMDEIRHKNDRVTQLVNTNRLIRFYDGADGVKTGSTSEAKFCISATAQRGRERFIAVVLGASTSAKRFETAQKLLTYAFDHYSTNTLLTAGQTAKEGIPVKGSRSKTASVAAQSDLSVLCKRGDEGSAELVLSLPEVLRAPLAKGEVVGEAVAVKNGEEIARVPLVLEQDLTQNSIWGSIRDVLEGWMKPGQANRAEKKQLGKNKFTIRV